MRPFRDISGEKYGEGWLDIAQSKVVLLEEMEGKIQRKHDYLKGIKKYLYNIFGYL